MHDKTLMIQSRLARMLVERIRPAVHRPVAELHVEAWHVGGGQGEPVAPAVALNETYAPFRIGQPWGPPWGTSWFHLTGTIPTHAAGLRVEAVVDLGWAAHSPGFQAEGLVYRRDGSVIKGLNPLNGWIPLADEAAGGERVDLYVEAAANPMIQEPYLFRPTRFGEKATAGTDPIYRLARADVSVLQEQVWELVADLEVLGGLASSLAASDARRSEILFAVERSLDQHRAR